MTMYFRYRNRILLTATASLIILAALLGLVGQVNALISLLGGGFVGLMNFFLLAREINRFAPGSGLSKATKNLMLTSAFRYGVMFVGFAVCAGKNWFQALPFCVGVFLVQGVIVVSAFMVKNEDFNEEKELVIP